MGIHEAAMKWEKNPLLRGIWRVSTRLARFKALVRDFYYAVLLSNHPCRECGGKLRMGGPSQCRCGCGVELDPTVEFQRSECCGAALARRTLHYVCSSCQRIVPSKYLFDERLFDRAYFAERMRESRERKRNRLEEIRKILANSRSGALQIGDVPDPDAIPGLTADLDRFVGSRPQVALSAFLGDKELDMAEYRRLILENAGCLIRFSAMRSLCDNVRLDRVRRFITLLFMEQAGEVSLGQLDNDIQVQVYETHDQRR